MAPVTSFTVATEIDRPMRDEQRARLSVDERAREPGKGLRILHSPAAVLQADRITQSASSFSAATSEAVR